MSWIHRYLWRTALGLWAVRLMERTLVGTVIAAGVACGVLGVCLLAGLEGGVRVAAMVLAAGTAGGALWGLCRGPRLGEAARLVDRQAGLPEHLSTALAVSRAGPADGFDAAMMDQTAALLQSRGPLGLRYRRYGRWLPAATAMLLAACGLLGLADHVRRSVARERAARRAANKPSLSLAAGRQDGPSADVGPLSPADLAAQLRALAEANAPDVATPAQQARQAPSDDTSPVPVPIDPPTAAMMHRLERLLPRAVVAGGGEAPGHANPATSQQLAPAVQPDDAAAPRADAHGAPAGASASDVAGHAGDVPPTPPGHDAADTASTDPASTDSAWHAARRRAAQAAPPRRSIPAHRRRLIDRYFGS